MQVTRLPEAARVALRGQSDGVDTLAFQHRLTGWRGPYWVGCSYMLPGGHVEIHEGGSDTTFVVLDGAIQVSGASLDECLTPMDSVAVTAEERCSIRNATNRVATLLLVVAWPATQAGGPG